jgi:hypothetical protein
MSEKVTCRWPDTPANLVYGKSFPVYNPAGHVSVQFEILVKHFDFQGGFRFPF